MSYSRRSLPGAKEGEDQELIPADVSSRDFRVGEPSCCTKALFCLSMVFARCFRDRPLFNTIAVARPGLGALFLGEVPLDRYGCCATGDRDAILDACDHNLGLVVQVLEPHELTQSCCRPKTLVREKDWKHDVGIMRIGLLDHGDGSALSDDKMRDVILGTIRALHRVRESGQAVYLHCKAGVGRSWMILMCYLIVCCEMEFDAAARMVKNARPHVHDTNVLRNEHVKGFATWATLPSGASSSAAAFP